MRDRTQRRQYDVRAHSRSPHFRPNSLHLLPLLTPLRREKGALVPDKLNRKGAANTLFVLAAPGLGRSVLPGHAALLAGVAVRARGHEVNVLFGFHPDQEGRHVHQLLAHPDVPLPNQHARVVNALSQVRLEHFGLQAALEELWGGKLEHEVQLSLVLSEETIPDHFAQDSRALKHALRVLRVEREQLTGSFAELGKRQLHAPDLALAAEAILAEQLELLVEALLLVRAARHLRGLRVVPLLRVGWHDSAARTRRAEEGGQGEVV